MTGNGKIWRRRAAHAALGGAISFAIVLAVAKLSARPSWQSSTPGNALVRLSFTHSGVRACRKRTTEELAKLPANMRSSQVCERRRAAVHVEMDIDEHPVIIAALPPSGLAGSGPSHIYKRLELPPGPYRVNIRLKDDPAADDFNYTATFNIDLAPAESIAIDFNAASGGFFLH